MPRKNKKYTQVRKDLSIYSRPFKVAKKNKEILRKNCDEKTKELVGSSYCFFKQIFTKILQLFFATLKGLEYIPNPFEDTELFGIWGSPQSGARLMSRKNK